MPNCWRRAGCMPASTRRSSDTSRRQFADTEDAAAKEPLDAERPNLRGRIWCTCDRVGGRPARQRPLVAISMPRKFVRLTSPDGDLMQPRERFIACPGAPAADPGPARARTSSSSSTSRWKPLAGCILRTAAIGSGSRWRRRSGSCTAATWPRSSSPAPNATSTTRSSSTPTPATSKRRCS